MTETALLSRIQVNPTIFGGKPVIRGLRIAVEHILGLLVAGDTQETILQEYPFLEPGDLQACLLFAYRSLMARDTGLTEYVRQHMTKPDLLKRITVRPEVFGGKPIIRDMRISVELILSILAQGVAQEAIVEDYPDLEPDDIRACIAYAHAVISQDTLDAV
jgi:uncharacterized protein (DUF433 family)